MRPPGGSLVSEEPVLGASPENEELFGGKATKLPLIGQSSMIVDHELFCGNN